MRQFIDLAEAADPFLPMVKALWRHQRAQEDDLSWSEVSLRYAYLKPFLKFPQTVFRGLAWEGIGFDAREDDWFEFSEHHDGEARDLMGRIRNLDLSRAGTCWTFDWDAAVAGGKLLDIGGPGACNCILSANVSIDQVNIPRTLYQNLTSYTEEFEIRLLPNISLEIVEITPQTQTFKFPLMASTGGDHRDSDSSDFAYFMRDYVNV